ncbi:hypothetical protein D3C75_762790 [compost metagenome]
MNRLENTPANHRRNEQGQHFPEVGGQQELNGFTDIAVHLPPFFNSDYNRCKIIIGEHHIGDAFSHIRSGDTHAYTDIRGFQRRRVIHPVSSHGDNLTFLPPGFDDPHFMFR